MCLHSHSTSLIILIFPFSLREFWNGILHGHTIEETAAKKINSCHSNTNGIPDISRRPIQCTQLLTLSIHLQDTRSKTKTRYTLYCWIYFYNEALATQRYLTQHQSKATKNFFKPRKTGTSSSNTSTPSNPFTQHSDDTSSTISHNSSSSFSSSSYSSISQGTFIFHHPDSDSLPSSYQS